MFTKLRPFFIIIGLILLLAPIKTYFTNREQPLVFTSPESQILSAEINAPTSNQQPNTSYQIFGFLPYWLLNQSEHLQYNSLTHLAYFGIEFDENAKIKTHEPDGSRELGYYRLQTSSTVSNIIQNSHANNIQPILVVKILNNDSIEAATDPANSDQVISQILELTTQYSFSGINIDFEYIHTPPRTTQQNFTKFIKKLRQEIDVNCQMSDVKCSLTVDIYPDTGTKQSQRLWQLTDLAPLVDHFIVMGYDYHRTTSPQAGPVAPIHGAPYKWDEDLMHSLAAITKLVPPQKLILGTPFYGYEWETYTDQPHSTTLPHTGRLATYSRVQNLLETCPLNPKPCILSFDPDALSPYLIFSLNGEEHHQIWYENPQSLRYKLQLIKESDMAGLAIWALGYESPHPDLWQTISEGFNPKP